MMKCSVKQRGKFYIVVDPLNHKSYTINNKSDAESLCEYLNNHSSEDIKELIRQSYQSERTELGRSVLRQLAEQSGVEIK